MTQCSRSLRAWQSHFNLSRAGATVLALALLVAGVAAGPAHACGELRHASAVHQPRGVGRAPLVIGDSTMIFAAPVLGRLGVETDAHGCRQFSEGVRMLAGRRAAGSLPHVAVLALGANGPVGPGQIASALRVIGRRRVLGLVTARRSPVTDIRMRSAARAHPDRVLLIDWVSYSASHGGWFAGDGLHVDEQGAAAYARLIRRTIAPFAFPPVKALRMPRHSTGRRRCGVVHQLRRRLRVFIVRGTHRIVCVRARGLARRPPLSGVGGWTAYDWRRTGDGPWSWVYRRRDGRVVVAAVEVRRR